MIRRALPDDVPTLVVLGRKFWDVSPWSKLAFSDDTALEKALEAAIGNQDAAVFVIERDGAVVGAISMFSGSCWAAPSLKIVQEGFWWVERSGASEARALLQAAEDWAIEIGAGAILMVRLEGLRDAALDRYYQRCGYLPIEHTYVRPV